MIKGDQKLNNLIENLFESFSGISKVLSNSSTLKEQTSQNKFGDIQLDGDIKCEQLVVQSLKKSGQVAYYLSEETPELTKIQDAGDYIVSFDPLDGSSIIGTNFTVGTIVAIWKNDESLLINKQIKDQITAVVCLYGPRTTSLLYNTDNGNVEEYTLNNDKFVLTQQSLKINKPGKLFAPGNLRATNGSKQYKEVVNFWLTNSYTLRYTGGMVPDIYQLFIKGYGIFSNIGTEKNPVKLRVLYEIAPLSFLVHKAEGESFDGKQSLLDLKVESYDQRHGIVVGTKEEVAKFVRIWQENQ